MIKISAVSYTNTLPFIYGLTHTEIKNEINLCLDVPATCAKKLIDNEIDVGLIPVAAMFNMPQAQLISDYCIAANGKVNSVFIFSNCPIGDVKYLQLDAESKTSNMLALVLIKYYWKTHLKLETNSTNYAQSSNANTAYVQIGDRSFGQQNYVAYAYDLAEEWKKFTGLPFIFAVWASNKKISENFIQKLNIAFKFGLDNRNYLIKDIKIIPNFDIEDYLNHKINYNLNALNLQGLELFKQLCSTIILDLPFKENSK